MLFLPRKPRRKDLSQGWRISDRQMEYIGQSRQELNQKIGSLLRHCTILSATLVGLVSALWGRNEGSQLSYYLKSAGVIFLCISVLAGVFCLFLDYRNDEEVFRELLRKWQTDPRQESASAPAKRGFLFFAETCPLALTLGVLCLAASVIIYSFPPA